MQVQPQPQPQPQTHQRQIPAQSESSSYRSINNSNSSSNSILNSNQTTTSTASTSTSASVSNQSGQSRIKRPQSESPPDLFSFDPFDESNRYRSPPPLLPPPSQLARPSSRQSPRRVRGSSFFDNDAEALSNFDWDSFLSQENELEDEFEYPFEDPFEDTFTDSFESPLPIYNRTSDNYGIVDLTDSSPTMAPPPERRRALSGTSLRPVTLTRPKTPKRKKARASPNSKAAKRRKISSPKIDPEEDVEVVDLAENANLQAYETAKAKQQDELIRQKNQDEATKPMKLVAFQCIICMDNPTDLTVTHCGHLFCSECLHSALHAGNNGRKTCPVCRTVVSTTNTPGRKPPKNGTFPISIKLMTANKLGKKPTKN
ncbi:hypothetical protein NHQ30_011416 [Ciborinia camelliae]|nr:hypothetical protein NHQ30_011416 [Ciborinia camelliae]